MDRCPIIHITTQRGVGALVDYPARYSREVWSRVRVLTIDAAASESEWPRGIYLITNTDCMSRPQLDKAQWLYEKLKSDPSAFAVLNNPSRVLGRYALLRKLHELGINDFNVHRVRDLPAPVRFPAFVRDENLHRANLSPIVHTQAELDDAIAELLTAENHKDDYLVSEYIDYRDGDRLFRKYGAQKVGPHVFGKHLMAGQHWMLKRRSSRRRAVGKDELPYVRDFPHRQELEQAFEVAGHDWARVDYSFYRGRVQVWEINCNPAMGTKWKRDIGRGRANRATYLHFDRALADVAKDIQPGPPLQFQVPVRDVPAQLQGEGSEPLVAGRTTEV
ncbi:MAG: hypothetical protein IH944_07990 [Armatimonadetes bacterium]|nr:hypothetical protein [Armatimonadota bacterium]